MFGYRHKSQGIFAIIEEDRISDFTLDDTHIDLLNIGFGYEALLFLGRIRFSISAGMSVLLSPTDIDEPGEKGWFVDVRPTSLRWPITDKSVIEFTPLTLDIVAPVTTGIPLLAFHYLSVLSLEYSFQ